MNLCHMMLALHGQPRVSHLLAAASPGVPEQRGALRRARRAREMILFDGTDRFLALSFETSTMCLTSIADTTCHSRTPLRFVS